MLVPDKKDLVIKEQVDEIQSTLEDIKRKGEYVDVLIDRLVAGVYVAGSDKFEFMGSHKIMTVKTKQVISNDALLNDGVVTNARGVDALKAAIKIKKKQALAQNEELKVLEAELKEAEERLDKYVTDIDGYDYACGKPSFRKI